MSPTTIFSLVSSPHPPLTACTGGGGGVPGVWDLGRGWEGLYRVLPGPSQDPIFSHIQGPRPYLRPNEGNSKVY